MYMRIGCCSCRISPVAVLVLSGVVLATSLIANSLFTPSFGGCDPIHVQEGKDFIDARLYSGEQSRYKNTFGRVKRQWLKAVEHAKFLQRDMKEVCGIGPNLRGSYALVDKV